MTANPTIENTITRDMIKITAPIMRTASVTRFRIFKGPLSGLPQV
jgi:hypothetical protein